MEYGSDGKAWHVADRRRGLEAWGRLAGNRVGQCSNLLKPPRYCRLVLKHGENINLIFETAAEARNCKGLNGRELGWHFEGKYG